MDWIFLAVFSISLFSLSNIIDKIVLDKYINNAGAVGIIVGIAGFIASLLVYAIFGVTLFPIKDSVFIILSGVLGVFYLVPYFQALLVDEASRVIPLYQIVPVFTLILSFIFLKEGIANMQIVGFVLVLFGGFLISIERFDKTIFKIRPAFWYMMLASLLFSISTVLFRFVVVSNDFWSTFAYEGMGVGIGGFILFLIPAYSKQFKIVVKTLNKSLYPIVGLNEGIFVLARLTSNAAVLATPSLALVSVIGGIQPFFVFIYAAFLTLFFPRILKEDTSKRAVLGKVIPMVIILIGTYLMSVA